MSSWLTDHLSDGINDCHQTSLPWPWQGGLVPDLSQSLWQQQTGGAVCRRSRPESGAGCLAEDWEGLVTN